MTSFVHDNQTRFEIVMSIKKKPAIQGFLDHALIMHIQIFFIYKDDECYLKKLLTD